MTRVMKSHDVDIFDIVDVRKIPQIVRLTKWLNVNDNELEFVTKEYRRIVKDKTRLCVLAYDRGRVAIFVNDVTEGAFDRDGDDS